ncbi:ribonuclease R [Stackebrandtia albiflava]|uniref:Ribonuclease R n=2 Tax=Stackebrandtia albiflava TaxID=406432 RepID=A0A562VGG2_9ACTN|nr:ribonuclease R [Stackebrandtia albiflava]
MIDSPETRDRDDAIWLHRDGDDTHVWIHIADVAGRFPAGTAADRLAQRRVHTRYRPGRIDPMLPETVEQEAALRPGGPQPTMRIALRFDESAAVTDITVGRGRLHHAHTLTYPLTSRVLAEPSHPLYEVLDHARRLATALLSRRRRAGALAFYDLHRGYATTEEGHLVRLADHQRHVGYLIVQELMIAANSAVADWCMARDLPILFRNHRAATVAGDTTALLDELAAAQARDDPTGYERLRDRMTLVQSPASYDTRVLGHHGLNLAGYTHATSPLRRYADLVNQRVLLAAAAGEPAPYDDATLAALAEHVNEVTREERRRRAERHRTAARDDTRRRLRSAGHEDLSAADFGKVVRLAVAEGRDVPELMAETRRRLHAGELALRDRYEILIGATAPAWRTLREDVHRGICDSPGEPVTVVNLHAQAHSDRPVTPETVEWTVEDVGDVRQPRFAATVTLRLPEGEHRSPTRAAGTKKDAKLQAAIALLATLTGLPDRSHDAPPPTAPPPAAARRVPPERNAAMAVNEYGQHGTITGVQWRFHREGPPHEPEFTCTVSALLPSGHRIEATGSAGGKQAAKLAAATRLRHTIEEALTPTGGDT